MLLQRLVSPTADRQLDRPRPTQVRFRIIVVACPDAANKPMNTDKGSEIAFELWYRNPELTTSVADGFRNGSVCQKSLVGTEHGKTFPHPYVVWLRCTEASIMRIDRFCKDASEVV